MYDDEMVRLRNTHTLLYALSMPEGRKPVAMAIIAFNSRIRWQPIVMRLETANEGDSERNMLSMRSF